MTSFLVRRLLHALPLLAVASLIVFVLLYVGPNPLDALREDPRFSDADVVRLTELHGLDRPWYEQYASWMGDFFRGDMGTSMRTQRPAAEMILERVPLTLFLTGSALLLSLLAAIPIATYVATRRSSRADYAASAITFALMATPAFFVALLFQVVAIATKYATGTLWLPTGGAPIDGSAVAWLRHLALPIAVLTLLQVGGWTRYARSSLLTVLDSEFVTAACAKGLPWNAVLRRHAWRAALLPIVTIVAMDVGGLLGGAMIIETVFGLPGMGSLTLYAVQQKDIVVVLDLVMIGAVLMIVVNTIADMLYGMLDPRVSVR